MNTNDSKKAPFSWGQEKGLIGRTAIDEGSGT